MRFEGGSISEEVRGDKKLSFYPERLSLGAENDLNRITEIEKNEAVLELSSEEKENLLEWENTLGIELEEIYKIEPQLGTFFLDYFLISDGKADLRKMVDRENNSQEKDDIDSLENPSDVEHFLFINNELINKKIQTNDGKLQEIKDIAGKSLKFFRDGLNEEEAEKTGESKTDGFIEKFEKNEYLVEGLDNPLITKLIFNPDKIADKIEGLRSSKQKLKEEFQDLNVFESGEEMARQTILKIYLRRVNQLIAESYDHGAYIDRKKEILGGIDSEDEKRILKALIIPPKKKEQDEDYSDDKIFKRFEGEKKDKYISQMDRFVWGADVNYNEEGTRETIPEDLLELAQNQEDLIKESLLNSDQNKEELAEIEISDPAIMQEWCKWGLEMMDLLSDNKDYDPRREEWSSDGKWQVVIDESRTGFDVDQKTRVLKVPGKTSPRKLKKLFPVIIHELCHVFQYQTISEIADMRLLQKTGSDRGNIMTEGGAKHFESLVAEKFFGEKALGKPHYIRAMVAKLSGGDFNKCMQVYFNSAKSIADFKLENKLISEEDHKKLLRNEARFAFGGTRRLFGKGSNLDSPTKYLRNSQPSVYLEQAVLIDKLIEKGKLGYALIGGISLETIGDLMKIGLMKSDQVPKAELIVDDDQLWEKIKNDCKPKNI